MEIGNKYFLGVCHKREMFSLQFRYPFRRVSNCEIFHNVISFPISLMTFWILVEET